MTNDPWRPHIAAYEKPSVARATWQLINSIGAYAALWCAMAWTIDISWWLTLPIALLAGAILVRVFIIFHDCGHGSFFASRRANAFWGFVTGVLTFTPFEEWRGKHAIHHGTSGNLDRRGVGDVWTMTVREYEASGWWKRMCYRIARNPVVLLGVAPLLLFLVEHRVPRRNANARERRSVWITTLFILGWGTGFAFAYGLLPYIIIQLTVLAIAGAIGVWLFYTQHQFEGAYWQTNDDWSYEEAALRGSAFLKLPRIMQWFTGNIGFHHVHHLSSRVPNYYLQACHESHPLFEGATRMTMLHSLRTFGLKLWDEASGELINFRQARRNRRRRCA